MCTTTIVLDGPNGQAFAPGDTVSGKVFCRITKQTKIKTADIQLAGKIHARHVATNGQISDISEEKTVLFRQTITLFQGPFTLQPQTIDWPFEFVIPLSATYDRGPRADDDQFLPPGESLLPPSLSCKTSDFGVSRNSDIVYSLKASISKGGVLPDRPTRLDLQLLPTMPVPANEPLLTAVPLPATPWSDRPLQKHSLKSRMKQLITPDPTPATQGGPSFTPTLHLPTALSPSDTAPLGISIAWTSPPPPPSPTLILRSLRLSLTAHYRFRTASPIRDHSATSTHTSTLLDLPTLSLPLTPEDPQHIATLSLPSAISPDFTTWTIARTHTLTATLEIQDQTTNRVFRVEQSMIPFVVSPAHETERQRARAEMPPGYAANTAAVEGGGGGGGAKPPAYLSGGGELGLRGGLMQVAV